MTRQPTKPDLVTEYIPMRYRRSLQCAVALTAFIVSSCVMFVGPYDEVTDKAISDLEIKTEQFIAKMENTHGDYASNKAFYVDAKASVRSIKLRAELYPKNSGELKELDLLSQNLDNLEKLHRAGPLTGLVADGARTALEANFKSLMQIELAKKRSSGVSNSNG
jgi:hypothetical protein